MHNKDNEDMIFGDPPGEKRKLSFFRKIKDKLHGQLSVEAYQLIYNYTYAFRNSNIIDIGPGSGGSTLAMGAAITDYDGKGKIFSIDRFWGTSAFNSSAKNKNSNIKYKEANIAILKSNLQKYSVADRVTILEGSVHQVSDQVPTGDDDKIGLIFIDADGAIDRDLSIFYNHVIPHGIIVFDDYSETINGTGIKLINYSAEELDNYVNQQMYPSGKWDEGETLKDVAPMGKNLKVYRMVNLLVQEGFLQIIKHVNNTLFCQRKESSPNFDSAIMNKLGDVNDKLWEEFKLIRRILHEPEE